MYRAFELTINPDALEISFFEELAKLGRDKLQNDDEDIREYLSEVICCGTIDGTSLIEKYFPTLKKDVFLSYSHNDQDLAYAIAGLLQNYFGLSVFIDSMFWGNADELLKEIDIQYCYQEESETYNYRKRNLTTSHVHIMLMSAIMKAMDQSEIVIFLNTPKSAPNLKEALINGQYDEHTLSPWIYEEVLLTTMLKETGWSVYREEQRLDENALFHFDSDIRIAYKLPREKLISLTVEDIEVWHRVFKERKDENEPYGGLVSKYLKKEAHPLNILYEIKCGIDD